MPFGDGTGPAGMGPMTGRGAGYCAGYPVPGYMNPVPGRAAWGLGNVLYGSPAMPAYGAAYYRALPYASVAAPFGFYGFGRGRGRGWGRGFGRGRGFWL